MFIDDAEGADFGADGPDFGCHIDNQFIFVDEAVIAVAATLASSIQTGNCLRKRNEKNVEWDTRTSYSEIWTINGDEQIEKK